MEGIVHKLKLIQGDTVTDITDMAGSISLNTSIDTLGACIL